jgi:hypothetical protein
MSLFDESNLNVSQFVQLTETFLGEHPSIEGFKRLLAFLREGYEETEDEKMDRLMKVCYFFFLPFGFRGYRKCQ